MNDEQIKKWRDSLPEYEPTPEDIEAMERGRAEFERGEVYDMDEVFKSLNDEDDEEQEA
ncbi:hypothetical protein [Sporosarcina aquimarina]|uniref:hypothetical protein n=1 Tax=Sporosarcina aquimarina TaxID=114975 RepID=UPI001C8D3135|nr:hypothetical protein [Sporosarcina aquimarina]MBY0224113.1 hypothetical protein [Sporosarcina aquimarina]